jgi:hypothetical protein
MLKKEKFSLIVEVRGVSSIEEKGEEDRGGLKSGRCEAI